VGSEDIVQRFWERADSGGRDINDLSLFKEGDLFLPLGPPRMYPVTTLGFGMTISLQQAEKLSGSLS